MFEPPFEGHPRTHRPGERVIRRALTKPEQIHVRRPRRRASINPALLLVLSFAVLIAGGTALLWLPFATEAGAQAPLLVAFFTATSAATVTGHVLVDTADYWSPFGEGVILALIQLGGLGITSSYLVLLLAAGRRLSLQNRLVLTQALGGSAVGQALRLLRWIMLSTLVIELVGVLLLLPRFQAQHDLPQAVWLSVFHAISAYNNAGFDLMGQFQSLAPFREDGYLLLVIGGLIVLGGIGYTAMFDVFHLRRRRFSLETKVVLATSALLWVGGTVTLLLLETRNPASLGQMDAETALANAMFLSVSARTAGFSTVNLAEVGDASLLALLALMFIGGASGSAAGGIKVNTFATLFFAMLSTIRGRHFVAAFHREIPQPQVYRGLVVALLGIALVFLLGFALDVLEGGPFIPLLFDGVSALSTVGLSTGAALGLDVPGQLLLAGSMFLGRLGPITVVLALAVGSRPATYRFAQEPLKIG